MKLRAFGALGVLALAPVGLFLPGQASAATVTDDCKSVAVKLTDRDDTGSGGGVWAKDTMDRTLTVCRDGEAGAPEGKSWYRATVTDTGTFKTVEGKSPREGKPLAAGITGTINGGFRAKFTAPTWDADFKLTAPDAKTSSLQWIPTAFPGAEGNFMTIYRWAYKTACESYVDNNGTYTGDITKACAEPKPEPKDCEAYTYTGTNENLCASHPDRAAGYDCKDVKYRVTLVDAANDPWGLDGNKGTKGIGCESNPLKPAAKPTTPATPAPGAGAGAGGPHLPVTGVDMGVLAAVGGVTLLGGVAMLAFARKRRTKFTA